MNGQCLGIHLTLKKVKFVLLKSSKIDMVEIVVNISAN